MGGSGPARHGRGSSALLKKAQGLPCAPGPSGAAPEEQQESPRVPGAPARQKAHTRARRASGARFSQKVTRNPREKNTGRKSGQGERGKPPDLGQKKAQGSAPPGPWPSGPRDHWQERARVALAQPGTAGAPLHSSRKHKGCPVHLAPAEPLERSSKKAQGCPAPQPCRKSVPRALAFGAS